MNKKKKIILITIIAILIIILIIAATLLINKNSKKQTKENQTNIQAITEEGITKEEKINGLEFTNITLIKDKKTKQYTLQIDVKNPTENQINTEKVNIIIKDKDNNEIITLLGYIGEPMQANETRTITASTKQDLSKAKTKTIEIKE